MKASTLSMLEEICPPRLYGEGETIFHQGEEPDAFFYLKSGLSQTVTIAPNGDERVIMTTWPDAVFGASTFFEGRRRRSYGVALIESEVIRVDRAAYDVCLRTMPEFITLMLRSLSGDIGILFEQLADEKLLSIDIKVARFICRRVDYGQCENRDGHVLLLYNQTFIANVLGLSRWAVNKTLNDFRRRGWLRTVYGGVEIMDYAAIRCFAYGS